jgi:hypothetical protein
MTIPRTDSFLVCRNVDLLRLTRNQQLKLLGSDCRRFLGCSSDSNQLAYLRGMSFIRDCLGFNKFSKLLGCKFDELRGILTNLTNIWRLLLAST